MVNLDYPKENYELIIVDGGSTDETCEIIMKYDAKLIIDAGGSIGRGRNLGIANSKGDYVAFTDADCIVSKKWLKVLISNIISKDSNLIAAGGPNLVPDGDPPFAKLIGFMQETFLASGGMPQSYYINDNRYVIGIPNCNVIYKKKNVMDLGGFDNSLNIGEDAELCNRLTKKGFKYLYISDAIVWHHRPKNIEEFIKKMFNYGKGMGKLMAHRRVFRWYALLPPLSVILLILFPLMSIFNIYPHVLLYLILLYIFLLFTSVMNLYIRRRNGYLFYAFLLIPIQHLSYGLGFIKGIREA